MEALKERIRKEGRSLGNGILKVDSFVNHQLDPQLMFEAGKEFARRFSSVNATHVLTAEVSGIGPAFATALALGVPVIYARKHKPITMQEPVYVESAPSPTKGGEVLLMVSPEYLQPQHRVLIIDDILAKGFTILALARLVKAAGATLVGIGVLIEKTFQGGRQELAGLKVPMEALVRISSLDGDITFAP